MTTRDWKSIASWLSGKGIPFDVVVAEIDENGHVAEKTRRFYIRQPTTAEYDDAMALYEYAERVYRENFAADLRGVYLDELRGTALENTDAATLAARMYAALRRDRWLTARLLCDEEGRPVCNTETPEGVKAWDALPLRVKDAARPVIWEMLAIMQELPFGWERLKS
jgi:hypothetical protein